MGKSAQAARARARDAAVTATKAADVERYRSFDWTLTGSVTVTFSNEDADANQEDLLFVLRQDGTGSRIVTWPSNIKGAPTLTTTASKVDVLTFACVEVSSAGVPTYRLRASALNQTA